MCIILIKPSSLLFSIRQFSHHTILLLLWSTLIQIFRELIHFGKHPSIHLIISSPNSSLVTLDFSSWSSFYSMCKISQVIAYQKPYWSPEAFLSSFCCHSKLVKIFATERLLLKEKTLKMCCKAHTCNFDFALNIKMFPTLTGTLFYILH